MTVIEGYLLRQLAGPTIGASLALGAIGFLSQSLSNLDIIIEQRNSALVFLQLTLLSLPLLFAMILPIAVLVACFQTLGRLQADQELTAATGAGVPPSRLVTPLIILGLVSTCLGLATSLWVQPAAYRAIREISFNAQADLATSLFRPGEFHTPSDGVTVYGRSYGSKGEIIDLFVFQRTPRKNGYTVYNAREGELIERDGAPILVMRKGSTEILTDKGQLQHVDFDEYALDLRPMIKAQGVVRYKMSDRYLSELFKPARVWPGDAAKQREAIAEGHGRITAPLYSLAFALLAGAAILGGTYSRFGYGRRIAIFTGPATLGRVLGFAALAASADAPIANSLQYLVPAVMVLVSVWMILPGRRRVRHMPHNQPVPAQ